MTEAARPATAAVAVGRRVRAHWVLLLTVLALIAVLLTAYALAAGAAGEGHGAPPPLAADVPAALAGGGPVLNTDHLDRPGPPIPAHTIALTFDDGPGPATPEVLAVLSRYHVPATFFVIGSHAAEHPQLLRRIAATGSEIGVHTFTHPALGVEPAWRERLELNLTQDVIAAAIGRTTDLLRLPYSSTTRALTSAELTALRRAPGYRAVFATLDTRDWSQPGAAAIVRAATPPHGAGAIVMLHDGGGDRSETVRALRILIPRLRAEGYRFTTVTGAIGVPPPFHQAGPAERARGEVIVAALRAGHDLLAGLGVLLVAVTALAALRLVMILGFARHHEAARRRRHRVAAEPADLPRVSVVVPAYNEEAGIGAAVRSLAASDYPDVEVIVVDDGSTDRTAAVVAGLDVPGVLLIRQPNGGKPAALNAGIRQASGDVLVLVDGDTVLEPTALRRLVEPMADPRVGAVSGNTKVGNRSGLLGHWQHIEYVIGFNLDRRMFDVLQCMPTVPGAIGAFRRTALEQVGGVPPNTLAEDTDLTMAVLRAGWRIEYEPDAVAYTEAPARLTELWRQRYRWCYGTIQAMWKHRRSIIERGASGRLGRRGLTYLLLFQVLLPLFAPVVDLLALYAILTRASLELLPVWGGFLLLQYVAAGYAFWLDRESPRPLWALLTQQVVYRQLMYLVVIQSVVSAVAGITLRWQKLRRTGAVGAAPATQP